MNPHIQAVQRGRNSRVFGEKFCDKFITKFGEEFSAYAKFGDEFSDIFREKCSGSPISSPNLVNNLSPTFMTCFVMKFVRNSVTILSPKWVNHPIW